MLTPEREALLRELRYEDGSAVMVSYQDARNLIAEIDALRAKVAALEEAGEGLAELAERCRKDEPREHRWAVQGGTRPDDCEWCAINTRLARWREVRSSGC